MTVAINKSHVQVGANSPEEIYAIKGPTAGTITRAGGEVTSGRWKARLGGGVGTSQCCGGCTQCVNVLRRQGDHCLNNNYRWQDWKVMTRNEEGRTCND